MPGQCLGNCPYICKKLTKLSFAFKHIALMPDCYYGYGMSIGGVLATKVVFVPRKLQPLQWKVRLV